MYLSTSKFNDRFFCRHKVPERFQELLTYTGCLMSISKNINKSGFDTFLPLWC